MSGTTAETREMSQRRKDPQTRNRTRVSTTAENWLQFLIAYQCITTD